MCVAANEFKPTVQNWTQIKENEWHKIDIIVQI